MNRRHPWTATTQWLICINTCWRSCSWFWSPPRPPRAPWCRRGSSWTWQTDARRPSAESSTPPPAAPSWSRSAAADQSTAAPSCCRGSCSMRCRTWLGWLRRGRRRRTATGTSSSGSSSTWGWWTDRTCPGRLCSCRACTVSTGTWLVRRCELLRGCRSKKTRWLLRSIAVGVHGRGGDGGVFTWKDHQVEDVQAHWIEQIDQVGDALTALGNGFSLLCYRNASVSSAIDVPPVWPSDLHACMHARRFTHSNFDLNRKGRRCSGLRQYHKSGIPGCSHEYVGAGDGLGAPPLDLRLDVVDHVEAPQRRAHRRPPLPSRVVEQDGSVASLHPTIHPPISTLGSYARRWRYPVAGRVPWRRSRGRATWWGRGWEWDRRSASERSCCRRWPQSWGSSVRSNACLADHRRHPAPSDKGHLHILP